MTFRKQLQWGGLLIMIAALLVSITNGLLYVGIHNITLHITYAIGFAGLILTCTIIHIAQARRAGIFELITYLLTVLCLVYINFASFMDLVSMAHIPGTEQAIAAIHGPVWIVALYVLYFSLILFYFASAQAGVLPFWAGILTATGIALQLPAQFAMSMAGPMFFIFSAVGSILFGAGLIWLGWSLWSDTKLPVDEPQLSTLDQVWGPPVILLAAILLLLKACTNTFNSLALLNGIINLLSITLLLFSSVIIFITQARRAGAIGLLGFALTYLGAALSIIPAYLIMAHLAGQIDSNRALTAALVDFPFGWVGNYMLTLGLILVGLSVIRAAVFPSWVGWLVITGAVFVLLAQLQINADLGILLGAIGAAFAGIGLGWMGWILFQNRGALPVGQTIMK